MDLIVETLVTFLKSFEKENVARGIEIKVFVGHIILTICRKI